MTQTSDVNIRGCLIMVVAALYCLYQFFLQALPGFMAQPLMADLALNRAQTGGLASALLYSSVLLQIPAGWLVDRFGVRRCFIGGLSLMICGVVVFGQAQTLTFAIIGRLLQGAGSATAIVGALCLAAAWFPSRYFPVLVGLVEMACMLGGAACGVVIPGLAESYGWRGTTLASGAVGIVLLLAVIMLVRSRPQSVVAEGVHHEHSAPDVSRDLRKVFGSLQVWLSASYGFGLFGLVSVFGMMWGMSFLECLYPQSQSFAAQGMTLFFVGLAAGTMVCGCLVARGGGCRNWMIVGSGLSLLLLLAIVFLPVASAMMAILLLMLGLVMGTYGLAFVAPEGVLPASGLGVALAFINTCLLVAGQILQPLLGCILDMRAVSSELALADYQIAFVPLLMLAGLALVSSLVLKEAR